MTETNATPHAELIAELMNPNIPKNEREHAAVREIERLQEALAQPEQEQEPVAWHTEDHLTDRSATTYSKDMVYRWECKGWPVTPLYTSPPQRQPLTDEGIALIDWESLATKKDCVRAIEAAHGIGDKT